MNNQIISPIYNNMSSVLQQGENIAYDYELVETGIGAGVATIISILFIVLAIFILKSSSKRTAVTTATITASTCQPIPGSKTPQNSCQLAITYTAGGQNYKGNLVSNIQYAPGQQIQVEYDPNNPSDVQLKSSNSKTAGIILIIIAVLILLIAWGYFYFIKKNKGFAAVMGAEKIGQSVLKTI